MRFTIGGGILAAIFLAASVAAANPALLPKHEGYPGEKSTSPVTGQSLSNDPGQHNQYGEAALRQSAESEDSHVTQTFKTPEQESRILSTEGAGRLPKVQGPDIMIQPPVKEGTRMPKQ